MWTTGKETEMPRIQKPEMPRIKNVFEWLTMFLLCFIVLLVSKCIINSTLKQKTAKEDRDFIQT